MDYQTEIPKMIKLSDFACHIVENTRVCMKCKFKGMNEYQDYYGTDATRLPPEILNSLYVQHITARIEYSDDGIYPLLIVTASDQVTMMTIDSGNLLQNLDQLIRHDEDDEDTETI